MNWQEALAWVQQKNAEKYLGHDDWRLPNVKELQSIVDYTRSPDTTHSPAIDPVFTCTTITNEARQGRLSVLLDRHHACAGHGRRRGDVCRLRPRGRLDVSARPWPAVRPIGAVQAGRPVQVARKAPSGEYRFVDVHGAGAQRSDPKTGDPAQFPHGRGPQGDVIRIFNFVRLRAR